MKRFNFTVDNGYRRIFRWKFLIGIPSFCTIWRGNYEIQKWVIARKFKIDNLYFGIKVYFAGLNHKREEVLAACNNNIKKEKHR